MRTPNAEHCIRIRQLNVMRVASLNVRPTVLRGGDIYSESCSSFIGMQTLKILGHVVYLFAL